MGSRKVFAQRKAGALPRNGTELMREWMDIHNHNAAFDGRSSNIALINEAASWK